MAKEQKQPHPELINQAKKAWANAYSPYSSFSVGAALRTVDGLVFSGANIENASYGLTRCAEQSAIQAMASAGERALETIVIYTEVDNPASPCGACRQILFEFGVHADVFLVNHKGDLKHYQVSELLPEGFEL